MSTSFKFPRQERLKSRKRIRVLFQKGESIKSYPIRAFVLKRKFPYLGYPSMQSAFSAPKKYFKRAVHRNRIKRLMREAYRLSPFRQVLLQQNEISLDIMFIYMGRDMPQYADIQRATNTLLKRLTTYA